MAAIGEKLVSNLLFFQFHGAPLYFTDILSYFNLVFTLLFTIECIFKLVSFGPRVKKFELKALL